MNKKWKFNIPVSLKQTFLPPPPCPNVCKSQVRTVELINSCFHSGMMGCTSISHSFCKYREVSVFEEMTFKAIVGLSSEHKSALRLKS